jgi:photosystem II stability/assembly factor-like uncharacterized protein
MKKVVFGLIVATAILAAGCTPITSGGFDLRNQTVAITGVSLAPPSVTIAQDETVTLTATVNPDNATNKVVTWTVATAENGEVEIETRDSAVIVKGVTAGTATVTAATENGEYSATCAVTVTPTVRSIEITTSPDKTDYDIGDELDLTGLVVTATYGGKTPDGPITIDKNHISGFDSETVGTKTVIITYNGKTAEFTVTVNPLFNRITVKSPPATTDYYLGEPLDLAGLAVAAVYSDESETTVPNKDLTVSGFDSETAGNKTVIITYNGKTAEFTVTVKNQRYIGDWTAIPNYGTNGGGGYVMSANGIFLAAHWMNGNISYSNDGVNWSVLTGTDTSFTKYIACLNGKFWAVGQSGKIATSPNGQDWTAVPQNVADTDIYSIAYGVINGAETYVFVTDNMSVTGNGSQIVYSTDGGATWAQATNPVSTLKIDSIVFADGKFVVFTNTGYISYTTTDINTWANRFMVDTGKGMNSEHFKMAAVGNGTIIATSRAAYAYASTSDLSSWKWSVVYPSGDYSYHIWLNCVVFDGERFIMGGLNGTMAYTSDGTTFTADSHFDDSSLSWTHGLFAGLYINGIAYDSGKHRYVASGGDTQSVGAYIDRWF